MESEMWPCPNCGDDREFVQPPCVDGHAADGAECAEWACAECGIALLVGEVVVVADLPLRRAA